MRCDGYYFEDVSFDSGDESARVKVDILAQEAFPKRLLAGIFRTPFFLKTGMSVCSYCAWSAAVLFFC